MLSENTCLRTRCFNKHYHLFVLFSLCCLPTLVQLRWHEEQKYFHLPTPPSNRHHSPQQPHYRRTATYSHTLTHTHTHTHTIAAVLATNTKYTSTLNSTSLVLTRQFCGSKRTASPHKPATTLITVPLHQSSSHLWPKYLSSTISSTRLLLQLFSFGNSCPLCSSAQQPDDVLSALC